MYQFGGYFQGYVDAVLKNYIRYEPIYLTVPVGFDGATANQKLSVFTPPVDSDCLLFGANVDFNGTNIAGVLLKITDTQSGYVWNQLQSNAGATVAGTPITAIAGITTQNTPVLPLVCPFFLSRQSKLQHDFTNAGSGLTTGGNITWNGIKLFA